METLKDASGILQTEMVVHSTLFSEKSGVKEIVSFDKVHFPGRVSVGDITSDGFSDILMTVRSQNGT